MNRIARLLLACAGFIASNDLHAQNWKLSTNINASVDFYGVHFTDDHTGYAVGTAGSIYKTVDGGISWTAQTSNTTQTLNDVFFPNSTTGFAVGNNGVIRKTVDGGANWTTLTASGTTTTAFQEVLFLNASNGYIVGSGGKVIKTTNGGSAWSTLTTGTVSDIQGVHFVNVNTGYFVASGGLIRKTTDAGANWSTLTIGTTENLNDIFFIDGTGYTCGMNGEVWQTTDGGANWTLKANGLGSLELYSIHFADALVGNVSSFGSRHWTTIDGAANWIGFLLAGNVSLYDTYYSSVNAGYMVGSSGTFVKYQSQLEPEIQPGDMAFSEVYATTMRVSYSASPDIPTGYIAIRKEGSAPTTDPMDGFTYTEGQSLGDGTVVFIGDGTSFEQTGLTAATQYFYKLYAYNGAGAATNYKHSDPLSGSKATYSSGTAWTSIYTAGFSFPRDAHFYDANAGGVSGGFNLLATANGGQDWTNGFPGNGDAYGGHFFPSPTIGYVVGSGSGTRVIRRTVNGGATWVDQVRATATSGFYDVWFTSTISGVAVGGEGQIYRTTNGVSWSSVTSGTTTYLYGVNCAGTNCFAVGQGGWILKSGNSGSSWITLPVSTIITSNDLNDVYFVDSNTGYLVGAAGTILKTTDGGTIFNFQTSGTTENLNSVHFVDANTGYVVGDNSTILKTTDGGTNWYPFTAGLGTIDIQGVYFPTAHTGYAVGWSGTTGEIYKFQSVPEPPSQPTALLFSSINANGVSVSFTAPVVPTDGFLAIRKPGGPPTSIPLDGVAYSAGTVIGDGTVAYFGSSTSFTETTLSPGQEYYYKVFSYNSSGEAGSTAYMTSSPLAGSTTTTLVAPVASSASPVGSSSFTANWAAVTGASSYRLDVSADGFSSFVAGFNDVTVGSTSLSVTGLSSGTAYSYRVRAVNVSGASVSSSAVSVLTLPAAPVASAGTSVSTSGFTANWAAAFGSTGYLLDVSTNSFSTYVSGYHDLALSTTSLAITGLTAGTTYQYRLRAVNASGNSVYSGTISTITLCAPPTVNAATSITASGFTANWSSITGASDYRIDVASDPSFNFIVGSYNNLTVTGTSTAVTGLSAGTNYYYRIRASNSSGSSVSSSAISVLTLPPPPLANEALSVGSSSFTANWNGVATATGYRIDVSTSAAFSSFITGYNNSSVSGTSVTVSVPTEGITYYYRVRTVNATGASTTSSNVITTLLKPATPVTNAATLVTSAGFTANWAAASGANSYTLEVSDDNFVSNIPGYDNVTVVGLSSDVTDLTEGATYKYRVRAVNAAWSSAVSNTSSVVTIPPPPVAISANAVSTTGFTARWTSTPGAVSYRLDVTADDFASLVAGFNNLSVTGTSSTVTGLSPGVNYQYRVRALNASGTSGNSNTTGVSTLPSPPTANGSTSILSTGFTASWAPVTGATDYRLDVSSNPGFSTYEGIYSSLAVSSTSIAIAGLTHGATYYYRLRANNSSGVSANSNVITTLLRPAAPVAMPATSMTTTEFTANWDVVTGATSYKLDVSVNDFISNLSGFDNLSVTGNTQLVTGLIPGNTYKFRVRAVNASGASDNSNIIATVTVPPPPVANPAALVSSTGFTASWTTTAGISAYYLDVSTDNSFASFLSGFDNYSTSGGTQSITGLTAGTTYYYRVRAANISGTSANSSNIETITLPLTPTTTAATSITSSGFTANWSAVAGASEYRIDVSTDNNFAFYVGSYFNQQVSGITLPVTGLSPGTLYYYRIRAANSSGNTPSSGTSSVLTLPGPPIANDALFVTSTNFLASWNSVSTAISYRLDVSTTSNFATFIPGFEDLEITGTSITVEAPAGGSTCYYRVRAISAAGTSINSNAVGTLLKPAAPVVNAASSVSADAFTASWLAAPGATGYYLDVSSNNFSSYLAPYDNFLLAGTSIAITGLSPGTNYQFRVRSYNATGSSANSATISLTTVPPPPTTVQSTLFTTTSFTANWLATAGAVDYRLDVSTDFGFAAGSFVTGYQDLAVTGTSADVTDLVAGTVYYYRVRAVNASGTSANSNVTSSTNVPPPPSALNASTITTTAFSVTWAATPGALGYLLDVSSDNFASYVNAYNNLSVTGTQINLVSLTPGTSYQVRVRATNASGTSLNSPVITVQTLPEEPAAQPTAIVFSNITPVAMTISFTGSLGGAAGYLVLRKTGSTPTGVPLDATTYNLGTELGDSNVAYVGSATSFTDSGLTAGTLYFYLVYAYNGNSTKTNYLTAAAALAASQVTVAAVPVLSVATEIGQHNVAINWIQVLGATDYSLDVSTDDFGTFVTGYQDLPTGNVATYTVNGLAAGTTYQFRLRSRNTAGASGNSAKQSVLTIPATPVGLTASSVTATSFEAAWDVVPGAVSYFVDLSTDENFSILVVNNGTTGDPHVPLSGLGNSTKYYARVRSGNASGVSPSSTALSVTTLAGGAGAAGLLIGTPNFSTSIKGAAVPVSVSVTGGVDPKVVKLHHKKITDNVFAEISVPLKSGNAYEVSILPEMADELGVEFYLTAVDGNGTTDESDSHYFIYQAVDAASNTAIPFTIESFDGKAGSYQMFSIPYELTDNNIVNLFEPALNGFSNARWRLLRYVNGAFVEYPDQLKKIELGQAYWFNTIQADFQIKLGAAAAKQATPSSPFTIALDRGWNQVGAPYPFDVDWTVIQSANPEAVLSSLWTFNDGEFSKGTVLSAWKGAFVFSENGGTIVFPLSSKASTAGRETAEPPIDPSAGEWHLPLRVESSGVRSEFSIGMRRDAQVGKDKYDEIALPHFMDFLSVTSFHAEFFAPDFSADVVPTGEAYSWNFTLNTNLEKSGGSISWDSKRLPGTQSSVYLLDVARQVLVNMRAVDRYEFTPRDGQQLKLILMPATEEPLGITELGHAYPNPFVSELRIPVLIEQRNSQVQVQIYTALGQPVNTLTAQFANPGYFEVNWDGSAEGGYSVAEGLLLYRVTVNGSPSVLRKVIKANHSR